ncbi:MAG: prepilin-type N-terminal cleavage/methylation domain-containing protein [Armatimonas sp.]
MQIVNKKQDTRLKHGFTLIEIFAVVAIIGIVLSIAIASMVSAKKDAAKKACEANMSALFTAEEAYRVRNRAYTSTLSNLSGLLDAVPQCPSGSSAYTATVSGSGSSQTVTITCPNTGAHVTGVTRSTSDGITFTP